MQTEIEESNVHPIVKQLLTYPSYFEEIIYDYRLNLANQSKNGGNKKIVLATIDELALKHFGRFPWSRSVWAEIVKKLEVYNVKIIAFDVIFSEEETSSKNADNLFASSIRRFKQNGKIIIPYSLSSLSELSSEISFDEMPGELYNFILETQVKGRFDFIQNKVMSSTFPIPKILKVNPSLSFIGSSSDRDGVFRKYPLVANIEKLYLPSFALQVYQEYSKDKLKLNILKGGEGELLTLGGKLPLNIQGETKIRWIGGVDAFESVSLMEIDKRGEGDPDLHNLLNGAIVFIGSTSFAAHDLRHTPVDPELPGVFYHMNMTNMLLDGYFYKESSISMFWSWGFFIFGVLGLFIVSNYKSSVLDGLYTGGFTLVVLLADTFYFMPNGYQFTLFFILHVVIGSYLWVTVVDFYSTTKDKKFLKHAFGNYISPELIDIMYEEGHEPHLGGRTLNITPFFTDIQGFSTISEKLTAQELVEVLNEYLTVMTNTLLEFQGTLDKYEGDAIIAFFGAPVPLEDHATKACHVAVLMQDQLNNLRKKWTREGRWNELVCNMHMRIGVNSGEVVIGNMGSESRMNYTMMGDEVNLAARLEEAAKQYGIFNHVSQATKNMVSDDFVFRELDTIRVVGKSIPVTTYELLGHKNSIDHQLIDLAVRFDQGIDLYKNQKWTQALIIFKETLLLETIRFPNSTIIASPSSIYIQRCNEFIKEPPVLDWDGVYTLTHK